MNKGRFQAPPRFCSYSFDLLPLFVVVTTAWHHFATQFNRLVLCAFVHICLHLSTTVNTGRSANASRARTNTKNNLKKKSSLWLRMRACVYVNGLKCGWRCVGSRLCHLSVVQLPHGFFSALCCSDIYTQPAGQPLVTDSLWERHWLYCLTLGRGLQDSIIVTLVSHYFIIMVLLR